MSRCFKHGKKSSFFVKNTPLAQEEEGSSSASTTEEYAMEEDGLDDSTREQIFRQEVSDWLALNGKALFALESSKFLTKQNKSVHAVKPVLARTGAMVTPLSIRDPKP